MAIRAWDEGARTPSNWVDDEMDPTMTIGSEGGSEGEGGANGGGGEGGEGDGCLGPQSLQSVPKSQSLYSAPGPPSSHRPLFTFNE